MLLFNLEGWEVLDVDQNEHDIQIVARNTEPPVACVHCMAYPPFQKFGVKEQTYMDLPMHGKRVGIRAQRQRYRCKSCGRTFFELLPYMDEDHLMTERLLHYIQRESLQHTFVQVAETVGLSEGTIRNIFKEHVARLELDHKFVTPTQLGIDEIHLMRRARCVLTNIEERTVYDILPDRNKALVTARLQRMKNRQDVELVAIDMWTPYRDAVRATMPQAVVVVDKFHVVRMANAAVERVRKDIKEGLKPTERRTLMRDRKLLLKRRRDLDAIEEMVLQTWVNRFPDLADAYELKEAFYTIYDGDDRRLAEDLYAAWLASIPPHLTPVFSELTTAMRNWHREIFAYFDHRITNAYTEAMNGLVRVIDRAGRGYSFEALRAKMLYSHGLHRQYRPKYRKNGIWEDTASFVSSPNQDQPHVDDVVVIAGADISTLTERLENGTL